MQEVILYIQPQFRTGITQNFVRADLIEPELITLTQVIQDVKEIDKIFTDFSRTFNLPASKVNNKIFQHWYNPDIVGFDNQIMANARIELNHLPFKEGKIKLESVTMKHNKPSLYKVTFFGNTVSLNNLIGEEQLSNLVWLDNFNFDSTNDNIKDGLSAGLDFTVDSVSYTDAVIYPLITHSQQYIYNSTIEPVLSGTTDSVATDKLIDSTESFAESVIVGDIVKNTLTQQLANVVFIDSNTQLDISSNIFTSGQAYEIFRPNQNNIQVAASSAVDPSFNRRGVLPEDLKPAIKVSLIIKAIEQQYNLTFKTGEFFDSAAITNLYLWLHRDKEKVNESEKIITIDSSAYTCNESLSFPGSCTYFGQAPHKFENGKLTFEKSNFETGIRYAFDVTPTDNTIEYTMEIIDALTNTVVASKTGYGYQILEVKYDIFGFFIPFNNGDKFEFIARVRSRFNLTFTLNIRCIATYEPTNELPDGAYVATFLYGSTSFATSGEPLSITSNIPKMKVLDFLRGLFKMHNLTAFIDLSGQIVVKTLDSFYSGGDTLDLTKYINTDTHSVANTLPFTEIDFEYIEAKSILAQQFKLTNNRKFGEVEFISNASKGETFKIEAPFEHMLFERLNNITGGAQTDIQFGAFIDNDLKPSIGAPLLFYGIYRENISTPINFVYSTRKADGTLPTANTRHSLDDYWMPHNANELGTATTAPALNLNFGSEINSYTLTDYSGINNSLFQLYYQNYILRVFNKRTRLFNYKAILPLKILLKLSLDDTIIVQERAFTINKMTTKLQSGETQFELLSEAP